jgi:hypothetical protein
LASDDDKTTKSTLTREQYRKLKGQQEKDFEQRDKRRVQVERQYARQHHQDLPNDEAPTTDQAPDFKTFRWRKTNRRLNWIISILAVLILIVYLVLFFVN